METITFKTLRHAILKDTGWHVAPFGKVRVVLSRGVLSNGKVEGNWGVTLYQHKTGDENPIERPTDYFNESEAIAAYDKFANQLPK